MPAKSLAAMAKKAGKSLKTVEKYWNQAKASFKKYGEKATNKYAYIMGIVKKRLGLADSDLALCGVPVDLLIESNCLTENETVDAIADLFPGETGEIIRKALGESFERVLCTIAIAEFIRVENDGKSEMVEKKEDDIVFKDDFMAKVEKIFDEGYDTMRMKELFPGVPDDIIELLKWESKSESRYVPMNRLPKHLTIPEKHQLRIAYDTLKLSDVGAHIMGGMTKEEARRVIRRLTGKEPKESVNVSTD